MGGKGQSLMRRALHETWFKQTTHTKVLRNVQVQNLRPEGACQATANAPSNRAQLCRLYSSLSGTGLYTAYSQAISRQARSKAAAATQSSARLFHASRQFHSSRESSMPAPALVPLAAAYAVAKIWLIKPAGALLKGATAGNMLRLARTGNMIRKSWEYKLARRLFLGTAIIASVTGASILVACDFDDARAAAVIKSIPRTMGAAGWCLYAGWTYKTSVYFYTDRDSPEYSAALSAAHQKCAQQLLQLCSDNGGIYVKAAQFLTSLQTIPPEYRRTLEKLQDQAAPQAFEDTKRVLEAELGAELESLFEEFEEEARAAASLAQVHKAKLHDGQEVAVKVQYLGLESAVAADLSTLSALGAIAALTFPNSFEFGWVVERLGKNLQKELDFRIEASNAQCFAACMAGNPNVAVPSPVPELSGARVLTMEWIEGVKLSDKKGQVALRIRPRDTALQLLKAFAQMIFVHGIIHGDPHGGNILVRPHPGPTPWRWWLFGFGWRRPQIVVLDHGLYVNLPDQLRRNYCALWCSFLVNDPDTAAVVGERIAGERGAKLLPTLLKPGALRSHEQRKEFKQIAGIDGLGDIGRLIEGLPDDFVQLLRISGMIRPIANQIGATNEDRLRINATYAYKVRFRSCLRLILLQHLAEYGEFCHSLAVYRCSRYKVEITFSNRPRPSNRQQGLWRSTSDTSIPATLNTFKQRLRMSATLKGLRIMHWANCTLHDIFDFLTFFPMQLAHKMFEARYV